MKISPFGFTFSLTLVLLAATSCARFAEAAGNTATLTLTSSNPISKCLDGTPHGFYHRPATSDSASTKWIFMLEGGGLCSHEKDCRKVQH